MKKPTKNIGRSKIFKITTSLFVMFVILFVPMNLWYKEVGFWHSLQGYNPAVTTLCEVQFTDALIRQPLSTFTNIFFLLFGVEIFLLGLEDRRNFKSSDNLLKVNYAYSIVFGLSFIFLFIGSTLYHASVLDFFSKFDMAGIYACVLFPLVFNFHRLIAAIYYKNRLYFSYFGTIVTMCIGMLWWLIFSNYFSGYNSYYVIPVLLLAMIGTTTYYNWYYVKKSRKDFILISSSCATIAIGLYWFDPYLCLQESYFQMHAIWHIFSALAMYYYYWYLRSEQPLMVVGD